MTNITSTSERRFPGAPPPDVGAALYHLMQDLDDKGLTPRLPSNRMPEPAVRRMLEARLAEVAPWASPAGASDILVEVMGLFTGLVPPYADEDERVEQIELYVRDLSGLPLWALRTACTEFRQAGGDGTGRKWVVAGDVRRRSLGLARSLEKEARELRAVLAAQPGEPIPVQTLEGRAANLARVAAWKAKVQAEQDRASGRGMSLQEIERAREISAAIEAGVPVPGRLPNFSPYTRKILNLPDPMEDIDPPSGRFDEAAGKDTWARLPIHDLVGSERL